MKTSRNNRVIAMAIVAFAFAVSASQARADSCSASASAIVSRSLGGSCGTAPAPDQTLTLTYRVRNSSIVDGGPNDGTYVAGHLHAGEKLVATLAQTTSSVISTPLPGVLTFVPVCPTGSTGGTLNAGDECDPNLAQCGTGTCGCQTALAGVTCTLGVDVNEVSLNLGLDIPLAGGEQKSIATIKVKRTGTVDPPASCGEFFSRIDSAGDILEVHDPLCDSAVTAGAQGSADLHAPECLADLDCGDPQCNVCANLGTDNHCATANIGSSCGTDANTTDCMTPACVDSSGTGVCEQKQNDVLQGTSCTNNDGTPVSALECQVPVCDAGGTCANAADPTQDGNACGIDANTTDCVTPACLAGACEQGQIDLAAGTTCDNNGGSALPTVECREPLCLAGGTCSNEPDLTQDGNACGTDANTTDCLTPACLTGNCAQEQNPIPAGTSCTNNGGTSVPAVECQLPLCGAGGVCANQADASQDGNACGIDANTTDCLTPACLTGSCLQGQTPIPSGLACDNNGGSSVPAVECQTPLCGAGGVCDNVADPSQDGDACTDTDATNCYLAKCASGGCDQNAVCDPTENAALCQVTISDTIFNDLNQDGIQDPGEGGLSGVGVDVYACSGGNPVTLQGSDTTDGSGLYSFSVATCNPSETLAIDVSGSFSGALSGYTESPAFCDEADPTMCGAEVTPAVDSNCTSGVSDCRSISRGATDATVDCGYSSPCEVAVDKEACVPQPMAEGCTGSALAVLLQWTGASALPAGSNVVVKGSSGVTASITLAADLQPGDNLAIPGQNGFTLDSTGTAFTKLGTSVTLAVNGVTQEIFHTSCSCPDSYTVGGTTYYTNLILDEPMCLDASSPHNLAAAKGYPSALWALAGLKDPTNGTSFIDSAADCNSQLSAMEGEACAIKDNRITKLQLTYVGAQGKATNCANKVAVFPKSQDTGKKLKCTGTALDNQPVRVVIIAKRSGSVWFDSGAANINLGDTFTATSGAKKDLEDESLIRVFDAGGTKIEEISIASACHDRFVNVGDVYGGFKVIGTAGTKGGELPEDQCPEVEYRYSLTSASPVSVRACDDQLGDLGVYALQAGTPLEFTENEQLDNVGGQCLPLSNTVRVFPSAVACPDPASSVPPDDCGSATAVIAPPPPPPYVCTKPIDSLTMIWNGPEPVNVTAWKGVVGSTNLGTVSGVVKGQEVTFTGFAGSPNDVVWQISGATSGLSDFHLSCSDADMNGPEDCGKPEGDAKGLVGFLNLWLLEGISGGGVTLNCTP